MSSNEWYRNKIWNEQIEHEFNENLSRSKPSSRAQYLRIQAAEIMDHSRVIAIKLLNSVILEHSNSISEVGPAKDMLGEIYISEGKYSLAKDIYRELLAEERSGKSINRYLSDIKLIKAIVLSRTTQEYAEAYDLVKAHNILKDFFKSTKYEFALYAALLCKELERVDEAKIYAQTAINLLKDPTPTAPDHPGVGNIAIKSNEIEVLKLILMS